ncbi:hypothetical protein PINS_up013359 [Pythium insidiosum]|nr:hypothetical protein PINS_up013359 [Pythium insidiosum]
MSSQRSMQEVNDASSSGWSFATIELAPVDEQYLFEFEVRCRLRTSVPELVESCDIFRRQLLRDFPPELFLQRPAILLHILQLVQQPLLPIGGDSDVSIGANYFDEPSQPASQSFSWKPSVAVAAAHVACLKAIEAFLAALRQSIKTALDPSLQTFPSARSIHISQEAIESASARYPYPRVLSSRTHDEVVAAATGLSLGGAMTLVIQSLMPILRWDIPALQLHVVILLHSALQLLPDILLRRLDNSMPDESSCKRIERLLGLVGDATCNVSQNDFTGVISHSLVGFVEELLQAYPSFCYFVEDQLAQNSSNVKIQIPSNLWHFLLKHIARCGGESEHAHAATNSNHVLLERLNEIDKVTDDRVQQMRERIQTAKALKAYLCQGEASEGGSDLCHDLRMASICVSQYTSLSGHVRLAFEKAVLKTVKSVFKSEAGERATRSAVVDLLSSLITAPLRHDWGSHIQQRLDNMVALVLEAVLHSAAGKDLLWLADSTFFVILLSVIISRKQEAVDDVEALDPHWRLMAQLLPVLSQSEQRPTEDVVRAMPLLQHMGYADPNSIPETHRQLQKYFVRLINNIENHVEQNEKLLHLSRCLLHTSSYIRKAASAGLFDATRVDDLYANESLISDPFGGYDTSHKCREEQQLGTVEVELLRMVHPRQKRVNSGNDELKTSFLTSISTLRRLLASLAPTDIALASSTVHQLSLALANATSSDFRVAEEAGEIDELVDVVLQALQAQSDSWSELGVPLLSLLRVVLHHSSSWRARIRQDQRFLERLLSYVFHPSPVVRAVLYLIVLALTCSFEVLTASLPGYDMKAHELQTISDLGSSFGLLARHWQRFGIETISITIILPRLQIVKDESLNTLDEESFLRHDGGESTFKSTEELIEAAWSALTTAQAYRPFLDAMYRVMCLSIISSVARLVVIERWQTDLKRFFETTPTSAKDEIVLASVFRLLQLTIVDMEHSQQVAVVLLLRRLLPELMRRGISLVLRAESLRFLNCLSASRVPDLVSALIAETNVVEEGIGRALTLPASDSVLHCTASQVLLWHIKATIKLGKFRSLPAGLPSRMLEAVCRHRAPGSFIGRESARCAAQCLFLMEKMQTPHEKPRDDHWSTRLLFDSSSTMRLIGLSMLGAVRSDRTSRERALRLAIDTMYDPTECDAVRAAAAISVYQCIRCTSHVEDSRDHACWLDLAPVAVSQLGGKHVVRELLQGVALCQRGDRLLLRLQLNLVKLIRALVTKRVEQPDLTLTGADELIREDDFALASYGALIQALSVRRAFSIHQSHFRRHSLTISPVSQTDWDANSLSTVLQTVNEVAKLLSTLLVSGIDERLVKYFVLDTPLASQLTQIFPDIGAVLEDRLNSTARSAHDRDIHQCYAALDEAGKLFAALGAAASRLSKHDLETNVLRLSMTKESARAFTSSLARLTSERHPIPFRMSISRVISLVACDLRSAHIIMDSSATDVTAITRGLWNLYQAHLDAQPTDKSVFSAASTRDVIAIRRVVVALQALCQRSDFQVLDYAALEVLVTDTKTRFASIRLDGGFGSRAKRSNERDRFCLHVVQVICHNLRLLAGFLHLDRDGQDVVSRLQLALTLASNWNVVRVAARRGTTILLDALRFLRNLICGNDAAKATLASCTAESTTTGNAERHLLAMITHLALPQSSEQGEPSIHAAACAVLKSAILNPECLLVCVKLGLLTKMLGFVSNACRPRAYSTSSVSTKAMIADVLSILAAGACSDDAGVVVMQTRDTRDLFGDIFALDDQSQERTTGLLLLRNLALSGVSRNFFSLWESALDPLVDVISCTDHTPTVALAATVLWAILFDNQRAQSVLQSKKATVRKLQVTSTRLRGRISGEADDDGASDVLMTLERILELCASSAVASTN